MENSYLPSFFEDYEIDVANILLEIPLIISQEESRRHMNWGAKRTRTIPKSPSPPEQTQLETITQQLVKPQVVAPAAEATSPNSPLGLSLSQIDVKNPTIKLTVKKLDSEKRRRENLLERVNTLTAERCKLEGDLENVRSEHNKLMAMNLALKAKLLEEYVKLEGERPKLETNTSLTLEMKQDQHFYIPIRATSNNLQPLQMHDFFKDQRAYGSKISESFQSPYSQMPPLLPSSSGSHLLDLSISSPENFEMNISQTSNINGALGNGRNEAAKKRKERMDKMKEKKQLAGCVVA